MIENGIPQYSKTVVHLCINNYVPGKLMVVLLDGSSEKMHKYGINQLIRSV